MGYEYCSNDAKGNERFERESDEGFEAESGESKTFGLGIEKLEKILYNSRNIVFELFERFKKGELKNWSFSDLNEELSGLTSRLEFVDEINADYSDLTGRPSNFYNQYQKFAKVVAQSLNSEIMNRMLEGDYR
ncbi:MAG: hypothetical protein Q8N63_00690 [Nanoarchaeota archaeon]|nr:hypothetical protein [Nanoarchaeota archaeon]